MKVTNHRKATTEPTNNILTKLNICNTTICLELLIEDSYMMNKPENQDEDALGKIEQQQDFVILELGASIKVGVHL